MIKEKKVKKTKTTKTKVKKVKVLKNTQKDFYIYGRGRRRTACARVRIYPNKKSEILVNDQTIEEYFPGEINKKFYLEPLRICNLIDKYFISVRVSGSGKKGQQDAFVHGLSRALVKLDEESFKLLLKKRGFLTRDSRKRERRKVGTGGKARRQKQSPKR